jgi:hypothetical protein
VNWIGPVEGVFVTPGLAVKTPVGAVGVPPHVQILAAWEAAARLAAADPTKRARLTMTMGRSRALIGTPLQEFDDLGGSLN